MTAALTKQDIEQIRALSGLQQGMLYRSRSDPHGGHYIEQLVFEFEGFSKEAMNLALNLLIKRHRALRSFFVWREQDDPKLMTLRRASIEIREVEGLSLQQLLENERRQGLALDAAPMMRMSIIETGDEPVYCLWSLHHAIVDGWSIAVLQNELLSLYKACRNKSIDLSAEESAAEEPAWPPLTAPSQHVWQDLLKKPKNTNPLKCLAPTKLYRAKAAELVDSLSTSITTKIQSWCRKQKITFATFAHGTWGLLLAHLNGECELLFGSIDSGRGRIGISDSAVGMFMLLKPVRVGFVESNTIGDFYQNLQREQWQLNTQIPPEPAQLARLLQRLPGEDLFESVLIVQNYPKPLEQDSAGLRSVSGYEQADIPLTVSVGTNDGHIQLLFRYQAHKLDSEALQCLLTAYLQAMEFITSQAANDSIGSILDGFSSRTGVVLQGTGVSPHFKRVVCQFAAYSSSHPDTIALYDEQPVSYRSLSSAAESIRQSLLKHKLSPGDVVGIHLPRSKNAVAAMLAVMSLDACFLPLDPKYPRSHLNFILEDSGAMLVLSNDQSQFCVPVEEIALQHGDKPLVLRESFASESMCLIYTSGSTALPKGVFLQHHAVANRLQWMLTHYPYRDEEICCLRTPLSFVDSVCEIFGPLCAGVPAIVIEDKTLSALNTFVTLLKDRDITRLSLVPSLLDAVLEILAETNDSLPALKLCVVSGEALNSALAEKLRQALPDCTLLNLYGSTEVTADALAYQLPPHAPSGPLVPIGKPIHGFAVQIANKQDRILPSGFIGELLVKGIGVAGGYNNRAELTREKFHRDSFKTGDLAFIDEACIVHYLGRRDRQIKINGQRVEPSAVEAIILQATGIKRALAFKVNNTLTAVYTGQQVDSAQLQGQLAEYLPGFCVPGTILHIQQVPELANGKTDYATLKQMIYQSPGSQLSSTHAPSTDTPSTQTPLYEKQLAMTIANIWQELLPESRITSQSHFFNAGGHSLLAMRMIARTERALGFSIALELLVNNPVLADFAAALGSANTDYSRSEFITLQRGNPKIAKALFCIHGDAYNLVPHLDVQKPVYWISQWARRMSLTKKPVHHAEESIADIAKRYANLIEQAPRGKSFEMLAACGAAVVALETADQLSRRGIGPVRLMLMDLPRGELSAPLYRRLSKRQQTSWLGSLYYFTYRRLGGETFSLRLAFRRIEKKIRNAVPLTDEEAKTYTDVRLYSALADYKPPVYEGHIELVFSGRWRRGVDSPEQASVPHFWSGYLTNVRGYHFSPVGQHNDLLQGEGATFIASILGVCRT